MISQSPFSRARKCLPGAEGQRIERPSSDPKFGIRRIRLSLCLLYRLRLYLYLTGTENPGDCVTAIYVELAVFSLFELLDEIDESGGYLERTIRR